jgi:glutamyl-tRNA reductase
VAQVRDCLKQRRRRPMFMVDLAVPRDIDPAVAELDDVYLYTVDDLKDIIQDNLRSRRAAAEQAEEIIDSQVEHFMAWLRDSGQRPPASAPLRQQAEAVRDEALARAQRQSAKAKIPPTCCASGRHLTNKLIHPPCAGLREAAAQGDAEMLNLIKNLYPLDGGIPADESRPCSPSWSSWRPVMRK